MISIRYAHDGDEVEYPITLPAAELMVIMRNYETEQSIASLCTEDLW